MATLTLDHAQKLIDTTLKKKRQITMSIFFETFPTPEGVKLQHAAGNAYKYYDLPRRRINRIVGNAPACFTGAQILIDPSVKSCRVIEDYGGKVSEVQLVLFENKLTLLFDYAHIVFGAHYGALVLLPGWPKEMRWAFCDMETKRDHKSSTAVALFRFKNYCTEYLGFTPTLPIKVEQLAEKAIAPYLADLVSGQMEN